MKKNIKKSFLILILSLFYFAGYSCEICGCSSGNYFIGPMPQFQKHFAGVRYSFRQYHSEMASDVSQFSKDFYQSFELWGGVNIRKNWQILVFLPYNINRQVSDDGTISNNGLGDITAIMNYKIFDVNKNKTGQSLWIGGGIKLPSGKYAIDPDEPVPSANSQPGTGSVDFLINTSYLLHLANWGISNNINYKINLNADEFRFGNRLYASSYIYRSILSGKTTFNPNAGLLYEYLQANEQFNNRIEDTGGFGFLAAAGLETSIKNINIGFNFQLPIAQNYSNRQTESGIRGMIHLTYSF